MKGRVARLLGALKIWQASWASCQSYAVTAVDRTAPDVAAVPVIEHRAEIAHVELAARFAHEKMVGLIGRPFADAFADARRQLNGLREADITFVWS